MQLIEEWLSELRACLAGEPAVSEVRVGVFYTGVGLSTGDAGVAFTPRDLSDTVCCPKTAAGAPPAGRLVGTKAWELAEYALSPSALRRALGVATLNALSAAAIRRFGLPQGALLEDCDALDAAGVTPDDRVVMVGAFVPFIKALKGRVAGLYVVDRHREALKPDEQAFWVAPERSAPVLGEASILIVSGSALVEGGIDELLRQSARARLRLLAGPTTPLWAPPWFRRGVGLLGGVRVLDPRALLEIVGQGGSGYFFEKAAEKACVVDPRLALPGRAEHARGATAGNGLSAATPCCGAVAPASAVRHP